MIGRKPCKSCPKFQQPKIVKSDSQRRDLMLSPAAPLISYHLLLCPIFANEVEATAIAIDKSAKLHREGRILLIHADNK